MPADDIVATIGGRSQDVAERIARRLGRSLLSLDSIAELGYARHAASVMLVAPWDAIDSALLAELSLRSTDCGLSVGLLPAELHTEVTVGSRAPSSGQVCAYAMGLGVAHLDLAPDVSLFGPAGGRQFLDAVKAGAEVALLNTHGNGFDMGVGEQIVCARLGAEPVDGALPCFANGGCLRGAGPARDPGRYVDPRELRAEVLILDSCWGVMPRDGLYSPGRGVCEVALQCGATQAVLAPVQVQSTSTARFASILGRYLAGESLGRIALAINGESRALAGEPPSWILVGDPARSGARRMTVPPARETRAGWLVEPAADALTCHRVPPDARKIAVGSAKGDDREAHVWVNGDLQGADRIVTVLRTPDVAAGVRAVPSALRDRARSAATAALLLRTAPHDADPGLLEQLDDQAIAVGLGSPTLDAPAAERIDAGLVTAVTRLASITDGDLIPYWRRWMTQVRSEVCDGPCGGRVRRSVWLDGTVRDSGRLVARCLTHGSIVDRPGTSAEGNGWLDTCAAPEGQRELVVEVESLRLTVRRRGPQRVAATGLAAPDSPYGVDPNDTRSTEGGG
jgi:hypothetical protein